MAKNWKDLKPNDKLYLLVPIVDEDNVPCYEFQESYVINHKVTEYGVTIRFKHNDSNGKRQRKELTVANENINEPWVVYDKYYWHLALEFGALVVCHDNPEQLNKVYHDLFHNKVRDLQSEIEKMESLRENLVNKMFKNIIPDYDSIRES